MAGLTSIISPFFSPVSVSRPAIDSPVIAAPVLESGVPAGKIDVFEQGQWWKNQAVSRPPAGPDNVSSCNCGNCRACSARTYQQNSLSQPLSQDSLPSEDDTSAGAGHSEESSPETNTSSSLSRTSAEEKSNPLARRGIDGEALSPPELAEISLLEKTDTAVRAHEQAHLAVAGSLARGGADFDYKTGPDGRRYAVGGEVAIDTSRGDSPEKTLAKMRTVRAAALAPADPSPQDRKVAAQATVAMTEAVQEIRLDKIEEAKKQIVEKKQDSRDSPESFSDSGMPRETETAKDNNGKSLPGSTNNIMRKSVAAAYGINSSGRNSAAVNRFF